MMITTEKKEWFGEWFNSPFYHILYKNRDHSEAQLLIDNLAQHFHLDQQDHILDLACGKGRHSIYLSRKGLRVTGMDLSVENIAIASKFSSEILDFQIQDMREPFGEERFSFVMNLFTSFGYFETEEENIRAIKNIAKSLRNGGQFLIDFLNPEKTIRDLKSYELKHVGNIDFEILKELDENSYIIKTINFEHEGNAYSFQEKVKAISLEEFKSYFEQAGLVLEASFGDYHFGAFDAETSDRMILLTTKKA